MAKASFYLVEAMKRTARKLNAGADYQWGHMGACNCGNLAQELTPLSKAEIHERAMRRKGDWNEQCDDFCPQSGMPMDDLIGELLNAGLDISDLKNLENLSDKNVLKMLPFSQRNLVKNRRIDVILYLNTWADLLEKELLDQIDIEVLKKEGEEIVMLKS